MTDINKLLIATTPSGIRDIPGRQEEVERAYMQMLATKLDSFARIMETSLMYPDAKWPVPRRLRRFKRRDNETQTKGQQEPEA